MKEERKARLRIRTAVLSETGEAGGDRHVCSCAVRQEGGALCLSWLETREGQHDRIELAFRDGTAEMLRSGGTRGRLRFLPGESLPGGYETPWGTLDFEVYTFGVRVTQSESGGSAELCYELRSGGQAEGVTRMELDWRC